ncbi:MAG: signal peptidase I [Gammaproteobacteria bacterium]|nr:MAG: signal peptidase I [Gammaproteobacteria bacterium]
MDLELILVIGSAVTGGVWLLDRFLLAPRRQRIAGDGEAAIPEPWYVEYSKSFFPVLIIVLLLRSFVAEPFRIPSGSMMPTLLVGDFILVNKFAYGLRLPVLHTEIVGGDRPKRGDVIVFRYPRNPDVDYIKRVIGVPGDHVAYIDKQLFINGRPVPQKPVGPYLQIDPQRARPGEWVLDEQLPEVDHRILINRNRPGFDAEYIIPPGSYFVMGDNRDNSNDSRFWGVVPEANLVGKALLIWFNWDFDHGRMDLSRIGTVIE